MLRPSSGLRIHRFPYLGNAPRSSRKRLLGKPGASARPKRRQAAALQEHVASFHYLSVFGTRTSTSLKTGPPMPLIVSMSAAVKQSATSLGRALRWSSVSIGPWNNSLPDLSFATNSTLFFPASADPLIWRSRVRSLPDQVRQKGAAGAVRTDKKVGGGSIWRGDHLYRVRSGLIRVAHTN